MITAEINYWAVLVSAVVGFVIGSIWYTPRAFGELWIAMLGKNETGIKASFNAKTLGKTFVATLVMVYILAHFVDYTGATTFGQGALTGFWLWLGFVATTMFINSVYENRPIKLWMINAGCQLVVLLVAGAILAAWA